MTYNSFCHKLRYAAVIMYKRHIYSVWFSKLYGLFKKLMGFNCLTCFFIRNCKIYICIYLWIQT